MNEVLSRNYRYNWNVGLLNHMTIEGIPSGYMGNMVDKEMNIITRWIWGKGMALDQVVNCVGLSVKFQSTKNNNIERSKLVTKIWRYCKSNAIDITYNNFPVKKETSYVDYIFSDLLNLIINIRKDV